MKKLMIIGAVSTLVAGSANATISRIKALGNTETDMEGSYYIEDNRNIFLNAAKIHNHANSVMVEWGSNGYSVDSSSDSDLTLNTDASPKAMGGFLMKSGNAVYGAYIGNESNTSSMLRAVASAPAVVAIDATALGGGGSTVQTLDSADNQLDLFYGIDAGAMKYGFNVLYAKSEDEVNKIENEAAAARFGVDAGKWDAHLNLSLKSNVKETVSLAGTAAGTAMTLSNVTHEFDGKMGVHLGGSYKLKEDTRVWAYYKAFKWDQKDDTAQAKLDATVKQGKEGTSEGEFSTIQVGWGHAHQAGKGKFFTKVMLEKKNVEVKLVKTAEVNVTQVPLVFGYEAQATSWLTLRGSVSHKVYGKKDNKNYSALNGAAKTIAEGEFGTEGKGTINNTTTVNAGASLTFGKLMVDGFVGTTAGARNSTTGSKQGIFTTDNLMTRVGMTYSF